MTGNTDLLKSKEDSYTEKVSHISSIILNLLGAMIPRNALNMSGFDRIVPFLTYERNLTELRIGVLMNIGFLPQDIADNPDLAHEHQNSRKEHEMIAMVTKNKDLKQSMFTKEGNVKDEQRFDINNLNMIDMANFSEFTNKDNMKNAILEVVNTEFTPLDRSNPHLYAVDLNGTQFPPYEKVSI